MDHKRLGKYLFAAGTALLIVAVLLFIFVDTWAIAVCFILSILFNVAGLTLLTSPTSQNSVGRRHQ